MKKAFDPELLLTQIKSIPTCMLFCEINSQRNSMNNDLFERQYEGLSQDSQYSNSGANLIV